STKFVSFVVAFLAFICVSFATTSVKADTYSTNKEVVVNTLLDNGYTYNQAITIASSMDISSTETLVGVDILPRTERSVAYKSCQKVMSVRFLIISIMLILLVLYLEVLSVRKILF